jgi:acetylornithine deacetylase/succinyl-diaminopimelate desuccinylase-like protein
VTIQTDAVAAALRHRRGHEAEILAEFAALLAMPNVSRDVGAVRRNAEAIVGAFAARGVGLEAVSIGGAGPVIVGGIDVGASRSIGIYVHYDGQPVEPDDWTFPPFTPTLCTGPVRDGGEPRPFPAPGEAVEGDWRLYARAAADDKAPLMALLAALDGLAAAGITPTRNVKFLFDGEEEIGSPHLPEYLTMLRDRLAADAWLICDGPVHQSGAPQMVFGLRGISEMEITVHGPNRDLHSGHYGNWAPNPAMLLAQLLASMKDADGNVVIDGFYDGTVAVSDAERAALAALPPIDAELRSQLGLAGTEAEGAPLGERIMVPSLNVRGLDAGDVGAAARNVVPATATASLDIRLAPGNDPVEMLDRVESHIRAQGYHVVAHRPTPAERAQHPRLAQVAKHPGYPGARMPVDSELAVELVAAASAAADRPALAVPSLGGSVPVHYLATELDAPIAITPMANHDNNQHAADENLRIGNLWYGINLMAALLTMP